MSSGYRCLRNIYSKVKARVLVFWGFFVVVCFYVFCFCFGFWFLVLVFVFAFFSFHFFIANISHLG